MNDTVRLVNHASGINNGDNVISKHIVVIVLSSLLSISSVALGLAPYQRLLLNACPWCNSYTTYFTSSVIIDSV